jgi:hypothetical protein
MTKTKIVVAIVWALSLIVVAAVVASAQARAYTPLPEPRFFTGADVGFRVEGMHGDTPTGTVVIRINDKWVEAKVARRRSSDRRW